MSLPQTRTLVGSSMDPAIGAMAEWPQGFPEQRKALSGQPGACASYTSCFMYKRHEHDGRTFGQANKLVNTQLNRCVIDCCLEQSGLGWIVAVPELPIE